MASSTRSSRRSLRRSPVRLAVAVVAMAAGLAAVGCSDWGVPYDCPWSGTPGGVAGPDLVGDYVGAAEPGQALRLNDDGTYTSTGFAYGDWLNGYTMTFEAGEGRWEAVVGDHVGVPFVDVPFVGDDPETEAVTLVHGDGTRSVRLEIGGTRDDPVLFQDDPLEQDTCDAYSSLFRRG